MTPAPDPAACALAMDPGVFDSLWWVTVVEIPALAGLFWLFWRQRLDQAAAVDAVKDELAAFKLEVAKTYASTQALKDTEVRLTAHLVRIERKLDGVTAERARSKT